MAKRISRSNPIISYGIILYHKHGDDIKYLLIQRRDSIEYSEFIRGRYSKQLLYKYFSLMTMDERSKLAKHHNDFDKLWSDLIVNKHNHFFQEMYPSSKAKYESMKHRIPLLLSLTVSRVMEPQWGFPKGKKTSRENEFQAALREFKEETRLDITDISPLNIKPFIEIFRGTNGKRYSTCYYVAKTTKELAIVKTVSGGAIREPTVSEEVGDMKWMTLTEACKKLAPRRQKMLTDLETMIRGNSF